MHLIPMPAGYTSYSLREGRGGVFHVRASAIGPSARHNMRPPLFKVLWSVRAWSSWNPRGIEPGADALKASKLTSRPCWLINVVLYAVTICPYPIKWYPGPHLHCSCLLCRAQSHWLERGKKTDILHKTSHLTTPTRPKTKQPSLQTGHGLVGIYWRRGLLWWNFFQRQYLIAFPWAIHM